MVSPDVGGVQRTRSATKIADLAIIDKRRPKPGKSQVMNIIGNVKGKTCIIVDDIIDRGTIVNGWCFKKWSNRSLRIYHSCCFKWRCSKQNKKSKIKINNNWYNWQSQKIKNNNKIEVLSISSLMAEAIKRISNSTSVRFV